MVGKRNGLVTIAVTDELKVDALVGTAKQRIHVRCIVLCENITCMSVSSDIQSVSHLTQISQELCTHAVSCLTWN